MHVCMQSYTHIHNSRHMRRHVYMLSCTHTQDYQHIAAYAFSMDTCSPAHIYKIACVCIHMYIQPFPHTRAHAQYHQRRHTLAHACILSDAHMPKCFCTPLSLATKKTFSGLPTSNAPRVQAADCARLHVARAPPCLLWQARIAHRRESRLTCVQVCSLTHMHTYMYLDVNTWRLCMRTCHAGMTGYIYIYIQRYNTNSFDVHTVAGHSGRRRTKCTRMRTQCVFLHVSQHGKRVVRCE